MITSNTTFRLYWVFIGLVTPDEGRQDTLLTNELRVGTGPDQWLSQSSGHMILNY